MRFKWWGLLGINYIFIYLGRTELFEFDCQQYLFIQILKFRLILLEICAILLNIKC